MTTQDYFLSVRLKPAEHQKLKQLCQDSGLPASTVIRQLLVGAEVRPRRNGSTIRVTAVWRRKRSNT